MYSSSRERRSAVLVGALVPELTGIRSDLRHSALFGTRNGQDDGGVRAWDSICRDAIEPSNKAPVSSERSEPLTSNRYQRINGGRLSVEASGQCFAP